MPPEPHHGQAGDEIYDDRDEIPRVGSRAWQEDNVPGADDGADPACPRCGAVCSCGDDDGPDDGGPCAACGLLECVCPYDADDLADDHPD